MMKIMGPHSISCEEAAMLISRKQDEKLPLKARLKLKFHNWVCVYCAVYEKQINLISKKLKNFLKQEKSDKPPVIRLTEHQKHSLEKTVKENLQ